jgi:hypothetical protein
MRQPPLFDGAAKATGTALPARFHGWRLRPDCRGRMGWEAPGIPESERWWARCGFEDLPNLVDVAVVEPCARSSAARAQRKEKPAAGHLARTLDRGADLPGPQPILPSQLTKIEAPAGKMGRPKTDAGTAAKAPPAVACGRDSRTSTAAGRSIERHAGRLRAAVWEFISLHGGATDPEIAAGLGMLPDTARARRVELRDLGYIGDSGQVRPTPSGRSATVWIVVAGRSYPEAESP